MTGAGRQVGLPVLVGGEPRWRFRARAAVKDLGRSGKGSRASRLLYRRPGPIPVRHICDDKAARCRPLRRGRRPSSTALAAVRASGEHGFAHLRNWRVVGKVRTAPAWATALVRALRVLTNHQVA
ncbi:hypothetical protein Sm713_41200 [Streptomyces sp. TS71-3]|nr:hypothetical protein Sm713_41200 [Streptomyces sp. TS71-3]